MMVEAYLQQVDASLSQINLLELDMEAVESTVMLRLDATRNRLLKVETSIMALTSACGVGAMVAGIFGMNLNSGVQQADYWFWTVAGILVFGAALFVALFMLFVIRRGYLLT
jgi:magnesium transporter